MIFIPCMHSKMTSALHEFAIRSTSLALRDREIRLSIQRTTSKRNERATLVSTMDQDGNVLYRIVMRKNPRMATDVIDAMELDGTDIDGLAFTHQLLRQFLISAGWTYAGDARQRV